MYGVSKINIETDLMMISVQDVAFGATACPAIWISLQKPAWWWI